MTLQQIIARDLKLIEADLGDQIITWPASGGEEYACIPGSKTRGKTLAEAGFSPTDDFVCTVRKELFTDGIYPLAQQKLIHNGHTYRIDNVKEDATGTCLKLSCNNPNRGV